MDELNQYPPEQGVLITTGSQGEPLSALSRMASCCLLYTSPLGGLGEVGKNMTVYEGNGDRIIGDCGLGFPDSDMYGVDRVLSLIHI